MVVTLIVYAFLVVCGRVDADSGPEPERGAGGLVTPRYCSAGADVCILAWLTYFRSSCVSCVSLVN